MAKTRLLNQPKVCITCSAGGHWFEALKATALLEADCFYLTYYNARLAETAKEKKIYFVTKNKRNPVLFFVNAWQSLRILLRERPAVILSTGADVTIPTCLIGKLLGAKLIYIESGGNIYTPTLSGRIMYPVADLFLVQWEPLLKFFPKATLGGPLV